MGDHASYPILKPESDLCSTLDPKAPRVGDITVPSLLLGLRPPLRLADSSEPGSQTFGMEVLKHVCRGPLVANYWGGSRDAIGRGVEDVCIGPTQTSRVVLEPLGHRVTLPGIG
jgi:hypothetical protein